MSHRSASLHRCFTTASGRESFSESAGSQDQLKHAPRSVPSNRARPGRQPDIKPQPSSGRSGNRARRSLCHVLRAEKSSGTARTGDSRTAGGSGQTLRRIAGSSFTHTATVPSLRRRARRSRQGVKVPGWAAWSHDRHQDQCDHGAQESGDELAHQFAARAGVVHDADGFDGFALLSPPTTRSSGWCSPAGATRSPSRPGSVLSPLPTAIAPPPRGRAARPHSRSRGKRGVVLHLGRRIRSPLSFEDLFGPGRSRDRLLEPRTGRDVRWCEAGPCPGHLAAQRIVPAAAAANPTVPWRQL